MAFQIVWTEIALEDYRSVVVYLMEEWSLSVAKTFTETVKARLERLTHFPFIGIVSLRDPSIRSISLTKHNRLYYRIAGEVIEVLNIFDTRQDPNRNKC